MADFLLDDVGANPDLPFYRPKDFASSLGLRKIEGFPKSKSKPPTKVRAAGSQPKPTRPKPSESTTKARKQNNDRAPRPHDGAADVKPRAKSGDTVQPNGSVKTKGASGEVVTQPAGTRGHETDPNPTPKAPSWLFVMLNT
jgi:hypothetical protein